MAKYDYKPPDAPLHDYKVPDGPAHDYQPPGPLHDYQAPGPAHDYPSGEELERREAMRRAQEIIDRAVQEVRGDMGGLRHVDLRDPKNWTPERTGHQGPLSDLLPKLPKPDPNRKKTWYRYEPGVGLHEAPVDAYGVLSEPEPPKEKKKEKKEPAVRIGKNVTGTAEEELKKSFLAVSGMSPEEFEKKWPAFRERFLSGKKVRSTAGFGRGRGGAGTERMPTGFNRYEFNSTRYGDKISAAQTALLQDQSTFVDPLTGGEFKTPSQEELNRVVEQWNAWSASPDGRIHRAGEGILDAKKDFNQRQTEGEIEKGLISVDAQRAAIDTVNHFRQSLQGQALQRVEYEKAYQRRMEREMDKLRKSVDEVNNKKVDPFGYTLIPGVGGKFFAAIGIGLGGVVAGLTGKNPALDVVKSLSRSHMNAAALELEGKKTQLSGQFRALDAMRAQHGDGVRALEAYKKWMFDNMTLMVDSQMKYAKTQMQEVSLKQMKQWFEDQSLIAEKNFELMSAQWAKVQAERDAAARMRQAAMANRAASLRQARASGRGTLLPLVNYDKYGNPKFGEADRLADMLVTYTDSNGERVSMLTDPETADMVRQVNRLRGPILSTMKQMMRSGQQLSLESFAKFRAQAARSAEYMRQLANAQGSRNSSVTQTLKHEASELEKLAGGAHQGFFEKVINSTGNTVYQFATNAQEIEERMRGVEEAMNTINRNVSGWPASRTTMVHPKTGDEVPAIVIHSDAPMRQEEAFGAAGQAAGMPHGGEGGLDIRTGRKPE